MKNSSISLILVIILIWLSPAFHVAAQPASPVLGDIRFDHLSVEQGLSQSSVTAILQDSRGFLWIGTADGLNKYDCYSFIVYRRDPADPKTLVNNSINALLETRDGFLWVGTEGGLERFDRLTGIFKHYTHSAGSSGGLASSSISALLESSRGELWVGTDQGLHRYDPAADQFTRFLEGVSIRSIFEDRNRTLWVAAGGRGLLALDNQGKTLLSFRRVPSDLSGFAEDNFTFVAGSPNGLWVATRTAGLYHFDPTQERFDPVSLFEDPDGINHIRTLKTDRLGRLWAGTSEGVFIVEPGETTTIRRFRHNADDSHSLSSNQVSALYEDHTGVMWVGTLGGGLNRYSPYANKFALYKRLPDDPASLSGDVVMALLEDRAGGVWAGTVDGGLSRLDPQTDRFTSFPSGSGPGELSGSIIQALAEDLDGAVWVATRDGGLNRFDPVTGRFTHYRHNPGDPSSLSSDGVVALLVTQDGMLWVGTDRGLNRFDRKQGAFQRYQHDPEDPNSLRNDFVVSLSSDREGHLWIGTAASLDVFDPASEIFLHDEYDFINRQAGAASPLFNAVYQDRSGVLWIGTGGEGLLRLEPGGHAIVRYTHRSGLPNDTVYCILEDEQGDLWLSTNQGLARFNPRVQTFRNYDVRDGLQNNEFNSQACARGKDGRLYFGGITGFNAFFPVLLQGSPHPPPVVITAFQKANQVVLTDLPADASLSLSYQDDFISFDFVALDFTAPDKNQYAYKLEGFNPDWVLSGTRRYASYTNLPGGEYTFRVKAANGDGVWNETGAAVHIRVAPPLWEMWWFRISFILGLVGLGAGGYGLRVKNIQARNRELEGTVARLRAQVEESTVAAERNRLARELHDAVSQTLFSASLIAEVLPRLWERNPEDGRRRLQELRDLTRGALAEMRTLLLELRPAALIEAEIGELFRHLTDAFTGRERISTKFSCEGDPFPLPPEAKLAFYRIAQESLNNIAKHASASQVEVSLQYRRDGLRLSIADDGCGFDPAAISFDHLGIGIMRERAESVGAELEIHSHPGGGTEVILDLRISP